MTWFRAWTSLLSISSAELLSKALNHWLWDLSCTARAMDTHKSQVWIRYAQISSNAYQTRWASLQEAHLKLHPLDPIRNNKSTPILDQLADLQPEFNSPITKRKMDLMKQALTELRDELGWHLYQDQGPIDFGKVPPNLSFGQFLTAGLWFPSGLAVSSTQVGPAGSQSFSSLTLKRLLNDWFPWGIPII